MLAMIYNPLFVLKKQQSVESPADLQQYRPWNQLIHLALNK